MTGVVLKRSGLAGAASIELIGGVVQLRPEEAMVESMLRGWRAQQSARGLRQNTIDYRERLMRRFVAFTNEFPWQWGPAQVDEWTLSLTSENHLSPATINTIAHLNEYEGSPEARPFTREEVQRFLDYADDQNFTLIYGI